MLDGMFLFDAVIHMFDLSDENLRDDNVVNLATSSKHREWFQRFITFDPQWPEKLNRLNGDNRLDMASVFPGDAMFDMVFRLAPIDMAVAQTVPVLDYFPKGFSPNERNRKFAAEHPDRVVYCAGVDPLYQGLDGALRQMEIEVKEYGAKSFKFYNGNIINSWRCDDPDIAYPIYRKARELGVNLMQFHKGVPIGHQPVTSMDPSDLERAAHDFPDINFVIHHFAWPLYTELALSIAGRYDNIYLSPSGLASYILIGPREVQKLIGRALLMVGSHKLVWGSESALVGLPAPALTAFTEMEIPEDLRRGYGYPQITRQDRENMMGLNLAKLLNIDVEAKKKELAKTPAYDPARAAKVFGDLASLSKPEQLTATWGKE